MVCTCADSYVEALACEAGAAAKLVVTCKIAKYSDLSDRRIYKFSASDQYTFYPAAVEMLGPFNRQHKKLLAILANV